MEWITEIAACVLGMRLQVLMGNEMGLVLVKIVTPILVNTCSLLENFPEGMK